MQKDVKNKVVKVPDAIRGKVFFDDDERVLYVEGKHLRRDGIFLTYLKDLQSLYGSFKLVEDPRLLREKLEGDRRNFSVYSLEEKVLSALASLLRRAVEKKVSDIHIEVRETGCEVYFRREGLLQRVDTYSKAMGDEIASVIYHNAEGTSHQSYSIPEFQYAQVPRHAPFMPPELEAIRVQRGPMHGGHYVVLRLFYGTASLGIKRGKDFEETVFLTLRNYGYKDSTIKKVKMAIESGDGIVLLAGPTGSGKSTALKLFLELLHGLYPYKSIFTIENPPEYRIEGAKQLAVPQLQGWSFERVLREALRSDPDVIMIGEIREADTAKTAVHAALTGHQVFSTVHARNIVSIVERISGLGMDLTELINEKIARLFVAQRLVPRNCPHCKAKTEFNGIECYESKGCEKCEGTGVKGRVVLEEAMSFKDFELVGADVHVIERYLLEKGDTMMIKGLKLLLQGEISPYTLVGSLGYWNREELERAVEQY